MHRRVGPMAGLFALLCLTLPFGAAHANVTARYVIAFQGKVAGQQVVTTTDDGRILVDFSFRNNGRGPDLLEEMRVDTAGRLVLYRVTGKSTFGAPVDETFEYANGVAHWKSLAESGERTAELSGQYVPVENSVETYAVIARALLRQPDGKVAALPAGQLSIRRVREAVKKGAGCRLALPLNHAAFPRNAAELGGAAARRRRRPADAHECCGPNLVRAGRRMRDGIR